MQGSNSCLSNDKHKYMVNKSTELCGWQRAKYINNNYLCSLCSTIPLQYLLLMLTDLKSKIEC